MKQQALNPYLPSYEYVADGEPHVFGDRLYIFGSHDAFGADAFCPNDYVCYSAPLSDLGSWQYEGVSYQKTQDPLNAKGKEFMNAPDVAKGPDGRFYLYYQLHMETVTSVAVADKPQGPYEFYGYVKHKDGTLYGKRKKDAYNFDPSILVDDDGRIYMYTGFSPARGILRFMMSMRGGTFEGGSVVELAQDMLTIIGEEIPTIPGEINAGGTEYEGHGFFEASSIRKINGIYYLVYSSILSHELCYAIGESPFGPWKYGGTIISIGDIGLPGITAENARNFTGNTHGGMVCIQGQWYIFYHRQTNKQKCARQGCAEPITIAEDGSIAQVEMTSCGLNGGPLAGYGTYEARIACNLWGKQGTFPYVKTHHRETGYPYFTQSGTDREKDGDQYIAEMEDGAVAGFKYFDFSDEKTGKVAVEVRGIGEGNLMVYTKLCDKPVAEVRLKSTENWTKFEAPMRSVSGTQALFFQYMGTGRVDFRKFTLS